MSEYISFLIGGQRIAREESGHALAWLACEFPNSGIKVFEYYHASEIAWPIWERMTYHEKLEVSAYKYFFVVERHGKHTIFGEGEWESMVAHVAKEIGLQVRLS